MKPGKPTAAEMDAFLGEMMRRGGGNPFDIDPAAAREAYDRGLIQAWRAGHWTLTMAGEKAAVRAALKESTDG